MTDPMTSDELLALADRLDAAQDPNNPDAQVIGYSLAESMRAAAAVLRATASDNPTGTYPDLVLQLRSLSDRSCNAAADIIEQLAAERDAAVARVAELEADRTRLTGDSMTDIKMTYAYEAGIEDGKSEAKAEVARLRAAIERHRNERPIGDHPYAEAIHQADLDLWAAADRGDTDGDRNEGERT